MTRTIQTIAALAVICLSAPVFAHGSGHGGMDMGGNGHNGQSMNSMSWNKVDNKSSQTVDRHHDRSTKIKLTRKEEQIKRLEAELRRLFMEQQKTTHPVQDRQVPAGDPSRRPRAEAGRRLGRSRDGELSDQVADRRRDCEIDKAWPGLPGPRFVVSGDAARSPDRAAASRCVLSRARSRVRVSRGTCKIAQRGALAASTVQRSTAFVGGQGCRMAPHHRATKTPSPGESTMTRIILTRFRKTIAAPRLRLHLGPALSRTAAATAVNGMNQSMPSHVISPSSTSVGNN